jgi:hypothetical protein
MRGFPGCVHRGFSAEEADDRVSIRICQYRTRPDLALWLQHTERVKIVLEAERQTSAFLFVRASGCGGECAWKE